MARHTNKLSARAVQTLNRRGFHSDGGGLYLQIAKAGTKSWVLRYQISGKVRWMGLGSVDIVTLADARKKALAERQRIHEGIDPIEARKTARASQKERITFRVAAERYIAANRPGWKNQKHADQWPSTLRTYCYPHFGETDVEALDTPTILNSLEPIWISKPETASRVRGRIEAILDWARARGYRKGDNPARWRGHLQALLPPRNKVARTKHHSALPYKAITAFSATLREQEGIAARALEFTILTASRTGEVIGALWAEIDMTDKLWTVPAERMKGGREHRVPLSDRCIQILKDAKKLRNGPYVFPGRRKGAPLSNMAFLAVLKRMGRSDLTTHGFRSTFRDWAAETTNYPREVAELALAHAIGDKVEAAYRRGDLFEKRRRLMEDWARECLTGKSRRK